MNRASKLISLLAAGTLLLSTIGCNNTGPVNVMPTSTSVPTETPTPTAVPTETPTPTMPPDGPIIYDADILTWPQSCCSGELAPLAPGSANYKESEIYQIMSLAQQAQVDAHNGLAPDDVWAPLPNKYFQTSLIYSIPGQQGTFEEVSLRALPDNYQNVLDSGSDRMNCQNYNVLFWHKISDETLVDTPPKTTVYLVTRGPGETYSAEIMYTSEGGAVNGQGTAYYKQQEEDLKSHIGYIPNISDCEESVESLEAAGDEGVFTCQPNGIVSLYDPVLNTMTGDGYNPDNANFRLVSTSGSSSVP